VRLSTLSVCLDHVRQVHDSRVGFRQEQPFAEPASPMSNGATTAVAPNAVAVASRNCREVIL
jgi:hypothetical protein